MAAPKPSTGVAAYSSKDAMRGALVYEARKAEVSVGGGDGGRIVVVVGAGPAVKAWSASSSAVRGGGGAGARVSGMSLRFVMVVVAVASDGGDAGRATVSPNAGVDACRATSASVGMLGLPLPLRASPGNPLFCRFFLLSSRQSRLGRLWITRAASAGADVAPGVPWPNVRIASERCGRSEGA